MKMVVESFELKSSSGHRGRVSIRPVAGQYYPPTMLLECSRHMVNTLHYPVGTKFCAWVQLKQKTGCEPHLYSYYGNKIVVVSDEDAMRIIAEMQRG